MNAPFVQAEYNQLLTVAQRFKHNATTLATLRQRLQSIVGLLQHNWSGDAASRFFHEFETVVIPAIGRCHEVLLVAEQVTIHIRTLMRTAEEEAAALFKDNFGNVQDIIAFFDESHDMRNMRSGSWSSVADAGVLEAIQNGYRLHTTKGAVPAGFNDCDGAALAWQNFFAGHAAGKSDPELLPLWAMAEQRGVNYGSRVANGWAGVPPAGTDEGDLIPQFVAYGN